MSGICFFFEQNDIDVWSGRSIDLDAWNYAMKAAGDITKLIVINRTDTVIVSPDADLELFEVHQEFPALDGRVVRCVCPWDKTVDPSVSLYVPQAGKGSLHSVHIASVVMLHRFYGVGR